MESFPNPTSEAGANRIMRDDTRAFVEQMIEDGRLPADTDVEAVMASLDEPVPDDEESDDDAA